MQRSTLSLVLGVLLATGGSGPVRCMAGEEDPPNVCGYFVTRKGATVNFTKVASDPNHRRFKFRYGADDKVTVLPLAKMREISFGEESKFALITLKDGREVTARADQAGQWTTHFANSEVFVFYYFDEVARKETPRTEAYYNISRLVFDDPVGRFRRCPTCHGTWPDSYLFCPHDGAKTVWSDPGQPLPGRAP